jgi:hypothetical protein
MHETLGSISSTTGGKKKKNPKVEPETDLSDPFQGKS